MSKSLKRKITCTRCNEKLQSFRMLELSQTDGNYYIIIPAGHTSQGFFPFGHDCVKTELIETRIKLFDQGIDILPDALDPFTENLLEDIENIPYPYDGQFPNEAPNPPVTWH